MSKDMLGLCIVFCVLCMTCSAGKCQGQVSGVGQDSANIKKDVKHDTIPLGAMSLLAAYPFFIVGYADGYLLLSDSSKILYDDNLNKSFEQKLNNVDPEDMFSFKYDIKADKPEYLQDAGRSRCERLFKFMYGSNEAEVRRNLVKVDWFGGSVIFTKINGAADSLRSVARELKKHPELKPYLQSCGTFYWRKVRGSNRLSAHSYGIAIDIGVSYSDYWLWKNKGREETDTIPYVNRMPQNLIDIFEKHGFIWGGRWYHYDTMHFEYRPEVLSGCIDKLQLEI